MSTSNKKTIADVLEYVLVSPNETDSNLEPANVVDGLFAIARALGRVANALEKLGTANASTPMGAIEMLALEIKNGFERMADKD